MDGESETSSSFKQKAKKRGAGVKLSTDPQSVAARERRHRISNRFKILQSMVPGGTKMDTVSMLEEAIHYVKYLKTQIWLHQAIMSVHHQPSSLSSFPPPPPPPPLCSPSPSSLSLPPLPSSCFQDLEEPTQLSPYFY